MDLDFTALDNIPAKKGGKEYFRDGEDTKEAKDTAGKPQLTLVPSAIIWAIAEVREFGAKKYGDPENWRKVDIKHYRDAAYRHWLKYLDDPNSRDEESGLSHLAHLACNIAFLLELEGRMPNDMGKTNDDNKRKGGLYP